MDQPNRNAIWEDLSFKRGAYLSVFFLAALLLGTLFTFGRVPPEIPLEYSRPWGKEQLAPKSALWLLVFGGAIMIFVHFIVASLLYKTSQLSAHIVIWVGVLLLFFLMLSVLTVYLRVGPQT